METKLKNKINELKQTALDKNYSGKLYSMFESPNDEYYNGYQKLGVKFFNNHISGRYIYKNIIIDFSSGYSVESNDIDYPMTSHEGYVCKVYVIKPEYEKKTDFEISKEFDRVTTLVLDIDDWRHVYGDNLKEIVKVYIQGEWENIVEDLFEKSKIEVAKFAQECLRKEQAVRKRKMEEEDVKELKKFGLA